MANNVRWITLTPQEDVNLDFIFADEHLSAEIMELSTRNIRLLVSHDTHDKIKTDTVFSKTSIRSGDDFRHEIGTLQVVSRFINDSGYPILWLEATGTKVQLSLTRALDELAVKQPKLTDYKIWADKLPKVPARGIFDENARIERLNFWRKDSSTQLHSLQETSLDANRLTGNIENLVSGVEIPVGIAGPLLFNGEKAKGIIFAPFATTEGGLVASASRGATAISRSGGVNTRVISQHMMRVPLFVLSNLAGAFMFAQWIRDHVDEIRAQASTVSQHANLISLQPQLQGNQVHVGFHYETGDAAGQNMTTSCTWHCCQWLMQQLESYDEIQFDHFVIEANMSGDKKVNYQSFIVGRGTRVTAECLLSDIAIRDTLKVTPDKFIRTSQSWMTSGSQIGMIGFNINVPNTIAAIFTATGQDIGCVHESSVAQLNLQRVHGGIYASMTLPALIIGTVGGGTALPRQLEMLEAMDCYGPGKVSRFAEIIAGFCLALDLSTLSAVASGQFAAAHERLGRNRPVEWFTEKDLNKSFFLPGLKKVMDKQDFELLGIEKLERTERGSSILTELTARKIDKLVGHFPYQLNLRDSAGKETAIEVMVKSKPLDGEVILMLNSMAAMCGPGLAPSYAQFKDRIGFSGVHTRELGIYRQTDPRFTRHIPKIFDTVEIPEREAYVLVMERLKGMLHMDTADDTSVWTPQQIACVIDGLAQLHSIWYGRDEELLEQPWLGWYPTCESMIEMTVLWEALGVHAAEEFPEWVTQDDLELHREMVRLIPKWWAEIEEMPRTLIHNDFNPRNLCLRPTDDGDRLCVYDWELATYHLPQHDLVEFLLFMLNTDTEHEVVVKYMEMHRKALEKYAKTKIDPEQWRVGFNLCIFDLATNRIMLYLMAHTFRHYGFMKRVIRTLRHFVHIMRGL